MQLEISIKWSWKTGIHVCTHTKIAAPNKQRSWKKIIYTHTKKKQLETCKGAGRQESGNEQINGRLATGRASRKNSGVQKGTLQVNENLSVEMRKLHF